MEQGAETRDEIMGTGDLFKLLCERTAAEYRARWRQTHVRPPIGMIAGTGGIAILLLVLQMEAYLVFLGLTALLLVWYLVVTFLQSRDHVEDRVQMIMQGQFPPESVELVLPRLRWWNHLVVPQQWSKHSRIFEQEKRLEERRGQVQARLDYYETPEGKLEREEAEKAAQVAEAAANPDPKSVKSAPQSRMMQMIRSSAIDAPLPSSSKPQSAEGEAKSTEGESEPPIRIFNSPEELAERLLNVKQRAYHIERIEGIEDPLTRFQQELVFLDALLFKVYAVTHTLEEIEKLTPKLDNTTVEEPTALFHETTTILEHRRQLVMKVDRIRPGELMQIVSF